MSQLPSSLGGFHSRAALKPQTSATFTPTGGPGLSDWRETHSGWLQVSLKAPSQTKRRKSPLVQSLPTIRISREALSSMFSICRTSSYFPECSLSAERMNRMLSTFELRTPTFFGSMGSPSLYHVATGRGLPCQTRKPCFDHMQKTESLVLVLFCTDTCIFYRGNTAYSYSC